MVIAVDHAKIERIIKEANPMISLKDLDEKECFYLGKLVPYGGNHFVNTTAGKYKAVVLGQGAAAEERKKEAKDADT